MAVNPKTQAAVERGLRRFDLLRTSELEALSNLHSDKSLIISVYLAVPLSEKKNAELRSKFNQFVSEQKQALRQVSKEKTQQFEAEAQRLMSWLEHEYDGTGRGLAIFSSLPNQLWHAYRLPQAVRDQFIVTDRPYLRPLLTLMDEYERYLTLLVNAETARLFMLYMGEIEEYSEFQDELVPRPKRAGANVEDKLERHHEMHVLWHIKHAVEEAERIWRRDQADWLVIGGTADPLGQLREHLPKAMLERLAGQVSVAVEAPIAQVLAAVLRVEQVNEQRMESKHVDALLTAALGKGPGVLGLDDTLNAIVEGRVMMLVVEEDFRQPGSECPNDHMLFARQPDVTELMETCPLCGTPLDPQEDIVERAIERALEQDAEIEVVRGEMRQTLAARGHIGALLRYNSETAPAEAGGKISTR
ncbi:MAG TPA: hypothetical protein VFD70_06885 [Anaerolineae bacterium]|nr:hypothetical protein [Anaerolineae bacterium]